jgi:hypothetical protein
MAAIEQLQGVLTANPTLVALFRDETGFAVRPVENLIRGGALSGLPSSVLQLARNLSGYVASEVAKDPHLLPTTKEEFDGYYKEGKVVYVANKIISPDDFEHGKNVEKAVACTARTPRFAEEMKAKLKVDGPDLAEQFLVWVAKGQRRIGLGTAIVHQLMKESYRTTDDVTTFVTNQPRVARLFRRAADALSEDGVNTKFTAVSCEMIPFASQFWTYIDAAKYNNDPVVIKDMEGTNPAWQIDGKVLNKINQYLSGNGASFSMSEVSMLFVSDIERMYQVDDALMHRYGRLDTFKEALTGIGYSI